MSEVHRASPAEALAIHDSLPEEWRLLVHDYGLVPVLRCVEREMTVDEAREALREALRK